MQQAEATAYYLNDPDVAVMSELDPGLSSAPSAGIESHIATVRGSRHAATSFQFI
jgi:hypothetical protein